MLQGIAQIGSIEVPYNRHNRVYAQKVTENTM
jgi:hypothetical protein